MLYRAIMHEWSYYHRTSSVWWHWLSNAATPCWNATAGFWWTAEPFWKRSSGINNPGVKRSNTYSLTRPFNWTTVCVYRIQAWYENWFIDRSMSNSSTLGGDMSLFSLLVLDVLGWPITLHLFCPFPPSVHFEVPKSFNWHDILHLLNGSKMHGYRPSARHVVSFILFRSWSLVSSTNWKSSLDTFDWHVCMYF